MEYMNIRKATLDDACIICNIYNYYIENTAVTFEAVAVSEIEMRKRIEEILNIGYTPISASFQNLCFKYQQFITAKKKL